MKICIATPSHSGAVCVPFAVSLAETMKALTAVGIECQWRVLCFSSFIQSAREEMARDFLASDYTDLVFIDDDMGWTPEGLVQLVSHDVDVVGAICPRKREPPDFNVNLLRDKRGNRIEENGLLECAYIGTAFLRIRRGAFTWLPGPQFFDARWERDRLIGEDAWFCREYRRAGGRIWADPGIAVTHTGQKTWTARFEE